MKGYDYVGNFLKYLQMYLDKENLAPKKYCWNKCIANFAMMSGEDRLAASELLKPIKDKMNGVR